MAVHQDIPAEIAALQHKGPGSYRIKCPSCGRPNRRDETLGGTVDHEGGVVYHCFRCGLSGSGRRRLERVARPAQPSPPAPGLDPTTQRVQLLTECYMPKPGGPIDLYLKSRGLTLPPSGIVEHPGLWHRTSSCRYPAMIGIVTDAVTVEPLTLHRTWVTADGHKAPVEPVRMLLKGGRKQGGVIRLVEDGEVTTGLGIAEGVETALAAMAAGFSPVWACVDAGNLAAFPVLPGIECLTVFVDNDAAGKAAFKQVAKRWREEGREVLHFTPPIGDVNDWLLQRVA